MRQRLRGRSIRMRVEEIGPNDFAVVSIFDGSIVEAGFYTYAAAWSWIAQHLPEERYG
jgi:hypothetical protein